MAKSEPNRACVEPRLHVADCNYRGAARVTAARAAGQGFLSTKITALASAMCLFVGHIFEPLKGFERSLIVKSRTSTVLRIGSACNVSITTRLSHYDSRRPDDAIAQWRLVSARLCNCRRLERSTAQRRGCAADRCAFRRAGRGQSHKRVQRTDDCALGNRGVPPNGATNLPQNSTCRLISLIRESSPDVRAKDRSTFARYSARIARCGSTREARHAGRKAAPIPTRMVNAVAISAVDGSRGERP